VSWNEGFEIDAEGAYAQARVRRGPPCPHCGGMGRREVVIDGAARVVKCRCQRVVDRVAIYNLATIPARHGHATMENFRRDLPGAEPGWRATRIWLDRYQHGQENSGLVLYGPPGRGKTHLLAAALRELVFRYGVAVRFVEFTHLLAALKEGFDRKDGEATTLTPLVRVPVLAVDELGKGRKTDFELATIDEIVSRRYNARGTLLGTTNFPIVSHGRARPGEAESLATSGMETLAERLGERVYSRLTETVTFAPTLGEDFRVTRGR
jgi:DNA replication protein DnaC